jgi:iron complex transport system substrate-binding protein
MIERSSRRQVLLALLAAAASIRGAQDARAAGPRRIVSAGGAVTEILCALGREAEIVGVDTTSQHPAEALKTKANVGYLRALGAEGILSLKPSLVIAAEGAGPPDVLRIVESAGVPLVQVPDDPTPDGVLRRIAIIARTVDAEAEGAALARAVEAGFAELAAARETIKSRRRVLFVLSLQNGRPLVGGRDTTADGAIALAGGVNAAAAVEGWKPLSDEGVVAAAPEVVVMMDRGGHAATTGPDLFAQPAFAATPAARNRALVLMDGLYLLGFGPRAPQAARDLMATLYPELHPAKAGRAKP